jgi:hypothetical protein
MKGKLYFFEVNMGYIKNHPHKIKITQPEKSLEIIP